MNMQREVVQQKGLWIAWMGLWRQAGLSDALQKGGEKRNPKLALNTTLLHSALQPEGIPLFKKQSCNRDGLRASGLSREQ